MMRVNQFYEAMKVQFMFLGSKYLGPSKQSAVDFLTFWNDNHGNIYPLKTSWDIKHIERGPGWAPNRVDFENKIEYGKKVAV